MKKLFPSICILASLIVAGALFILPYGLGFITQNKYLQILNTYSKSDSAHIALLDYQRGWFSSQATVRATLQSKSINIPPQTLIIHQKIDHGPLFSFTSHQGEKSILIGQSLITSQIKSTLGTIDMVNWIKWNGAFWGFIHAPLVHMTDTQGTQDVSINDLAGVFKLSTNIKQFSANFSAAKILVKTDKFKQRIEQIKVSYDLKKSVSDLFLGQHTLNIRSIEWETLLHSSPVKFEGLTIYSYDEEKNRRLRNETDIMLKQVAINNANYGPQQILITVNQLDIPTLLALKKEFNKLQNGAAFSNQTLEKYEQLLRVLLAKGLEIQLKKLQLVTPWGNPYLTGNIQLLKQQLANNDMKNLLSAATITAEANLPAPFLIRALEQLYTVSQNTQVAIGSHLDTSAIAQQQVGAWINKKWLLPKNNGYQIKISYQDHDLKINGQSSKNTPTTSNNTSINP